jgi:hypothetical protein
MFMFELFAEAVLIFTASTPRIFHMVL